MVWIDWLYIKDTGIWMRRESRVGTIQNIEVDKNIENKVLIQNIEELMFE